MPWTDETALMPVPPPSKELAPARPMDRPWTPRMKTPEVPKGRPSGRPSKPRALDMDESLSMIQQQKHGEALSEQQMQAAKKIKDSRGTVTKLREHVKTLQDQLAAVQREREQNDKESAHARAKLQQLQNEHAVLQATHTWTKSSLDSALAAQEEYRKGYNSLRTAFKKAKEELQRKEELVEEQQNTAQELENARVDLAAKEDAYQKELTELKDALNRMCKNQREKAQRVLDSMIAAEAATLCSVTIHSWAKVTHDEKFATQFARDKESAQMMLETCKHQKKKEAKQVLDRMGAALDGGLVEMVFHYWLKAWRVTKKDWKEAHRTQNVLKCRKVETAEAEAQMTGYKKQRGLVRLVLDRFGGHTDQNVLSQVFVSWIMCTAETKGTRVHDLQLEAKYAEYEAKINRIKEELGAKELALEYVNEELAESCRKNQLLRAEFKAILEIHDHMSAHMEDLEE